MEMDFIRKRITELRIQKNVSEYKMSLDLGHSRSYIQNISSGRSKPSVEELLYICDYFGITPRDFFDEGIDEPILLQKAVAGMKTLSNQDMQAIITLIERMNDK